jgi:hypothetical protein
MPYQAPGIRHEAVATKECEHGQIVTEDGFVGTAFKSDQVDRWTRPADATTIAEDETFVIQVGGIHEAPRSGTLAAVAVGDEVWIDPADNSLEVASAAGLFPVGLVTEIDALRTPDVVRINGNALNAFLVGGA